MNPLRRGNRQAVESTQRPVSRTQDLARKALGAMLVFTGTGHLTFARREFRVQVPPWVPMDPDTVVLASGVVEIAAGASTLALPRQRRLMGRLLAALFVAVFPGNISQYTQRRDGFGLNTDTLRFVRLLFQPLLVAWALWSTGALPRRRG
jgi:uncharacterized membrane protein